MKNQEANRTSTSKCKDKSDKRRELLLFAMVVAFATVLIGSEIQMVVADEDDDESRSEDDSQSEESETTTESNTEEQTEDESPNESESGSDNAEDAMIFNEGESTTMTDPDAVDGTGDESPNESESDLVDVVIEDEFQPGAEMTQVVQQSEYTPFKPEINFKQESLSVISGGAGEDQVVFSPISSSVISGGAGEDQVQVDPIFSPFKQNVIFQQDSLQRQETLSGISGGVYASIHGLVMLEG